MALSKEIQNKSLEELKASFSNLSEKEMDCLTSLNESAAADDILLGSQSSSIYELIKKNLKEVPGLSPEEIAAQIYTLIIEQMDRETAQNKNKHQAQGHFSSKPIHLRGKQEQLNDSDVNELMPRMDQSDKSIEILAPLNTADFHSIEAIKSGIEHALKNHTTQHIMFLTGPGHWRGVYLSKPTENNTNYQLELFDSFGSQNANKIKKFILHLLERCGISHEQITVETTGPKHKQLDLYSCGDFAVARTHEKIHALDAKAAYEVGLIDTMREKGNRKNVLREVIRQISQRNYENKAVIEPNNPIEKTIATAKQFTKQENRIYKTTISAQKTPSDNYKKEVELLIKNRHSIFDQANRALAKEKRKEQLTDEELANKLQAEEFVKVGFKPR